MGNEASHTDYLNMGNSFQPMFNTQLQKNTAMEMNPERETNLNQFHHPRVLSSSVDPVSVLLTTNSLFKTGDGTSSFKSEDVNRGFLNCSNLKEKNKGAKNAKQVRSGRIENADKEEEEEEYHEALILSHFIPHQRLQSIRQSMTKEIRIFLEERQKKLKSKTPVKQEKQSEKNGKNDKRNDKRESNPDMIIENSLAQDKEDT